MVLLMTFSIFSIFALFQHGWFYHGAHRKFREQERTPRKQKIVDALILTGAVVCVTLIGLLAVLLAKGW